MTAATSGPGWAKAVTVIGLAVGAVLLGVGLLLGYAAVHKGGVDCGSAFGGASNNGLVEDYKDAILYNQVTDAHSAGCDDALSSRSTVAKALTWPGGILAGTALIGAICAFATVQQRQDVDGQASSGT